MDEFQKCVASLSSSVLCKEREVNPMRLTNPCQGPALSRTLGTESQGLTPSTAVAACQAGSGCRVMGRLGFTVDGV
ncbi:Uncharacterized protein DAT39_006680 [Clarias magur]|uniref:Uncharacterized protein n=1 Tax=Clarias magur TaxID=1594786 RepID=A0A8J4U9K8_CLAMG|nr:Uncharacterized protein DAT39_006680 [Clarias magur]